MKGFRCLLLISVLVYCQQSLFGQDIQSDLQGIRKRYYQSEGEISYVLKMLFYDKSNMSRPVDSSNGYYSLAKNMSNIDIEGVVMISNSDYEMIMNKNDKSIIVSKKDPTVIAKDFTKVFFDSIINSQNIITVRKIHKDICSTVFIFQNQAIDSIILAYNSKTFLLDQVSIYYNRPISAYYDFTPVVKLKYVNQKTAPAVDADKYDLTRYVTIVGKVVTLKSMYKGFSLVNNLRF